MPAQGARAKATARPMLLKTLADVQASVRESFSVDASVYIPVLVNSVDLKPGDTLKQLKGASPPKRPADAITPSKALNKMNLGAAESS